MTDQRSNNEFDSLESFFHEKLKDASFAKREEPWLQIEAELERMEKEKRKRRFFWLFFSGLALLGGMAALWFFVLNENAQPKDLALNSKVVSHSKTKSTATTASTKEVDTPTHENTGQQNSSIIENTQATENVNGQDENRSQHIAEQKTGSSPVAATESLKNSAGTRKIQLAASTKKANPAIFRNVPFAVTEVQGKDGIIRYFAETGVSDEALQTARSAGFASAFVKKNFSPNDISVTVKEAGASENSQPAYVASNTSTPEKHPAKDGKQATAQTTEKKNSSGSKVSSNHLSASETVAQTKQKEESSVSAVPTTNNNTSTGNNNVKNDDLAGNASSNSNSANVAPANTTSIVSDSSNNSSVAPETKPDSVPPVALAETKKDSVTKKPDAPDSSKTVAAEVTPTPFTPEWALLLLAGPNIFNSQAQSNLYTTSGETQPVSLNTELKVQFRPIKLLSFSGGVNYTSYSVKQDRTFFRFNKYQTNDYVFYSAFGSMAAPMSTLREGYSMQAPFDTFPCYYSQTSKLNMLNIPLEANLHLLSKSRIGVYIGLGANSSFALSQHSTLTLHKEHFDNNISYSNVTVNPFSLSLLFSLGCDVRLGKKLYLSFVPSYRYGVTNLSGTTGTKFSPAYFSGNAGLKFKF